LPACAPSSRRTRARRPDRSRAGIRPLRLRILAVGRCRDPAIGALTHRYLGRLAPPGELVEVERYRDLPAALDAGRDLGPLVALDEAGRNLRSAELAERLRGWRDGGRRGATFLIGGADGLPDDLLARAELRLAFGRATWPHLLVRVMLAEQLYRASTILAGHPYHRA
jgi:23S rRNA (pseudouridine1915-N3)-methyltransferase